MQTGNTVPALLNMKAQFASDLKAGCIPRVDRQCEPRYWLATQAREQSTALQSCWTATVRGMVPLSGCIREAGSHDSLPVSDHLRAIAL